MITDRAGLKAEMADPAGLGYAGKTSAQILVLLTAETRSRPRAPVSGREILAQIDNGELDALPEARGDALLNFLYGADSVDLSDANVVTVLGKYFPGGSTSRANLITFRDEQVSRLTEIGIGGEPTLHQIDVAAGII